MVLLFTVFISSELTDDDLKELCVVVPDAAVLTSMDNSDTDTASSDNDTDDRPDLPELLTALYDPTLRELPPQEIQARSEDLFHRLRTKLRPDQCEKLETITQQQSQSKDWHTHRAGRITSSTFHRVCRSTDKTSKASLMKIMHYDKKELNVPAVLWGKEMEDTARQYYANEITKNHQDLQVRHCGLVLRPNEPHLGSSPDGIVTCTCCGKGALEIKCPYKYRDGLQGCTEDKQFCLGESFKLKHSHQYYYQAQLHMFVCDVNYCDFVVWTKHEVIVQRVFRDEELLREALPKAKIFFVSNVLPELLTRNHDPDLETSKVCIQCEKPDYGKMIHCVQCDSHFHYSCVQIKRKLPNWLCKQCKR